jgi:hypothetical protein
MGHQSAAGCGAPPPRQRQFALSSGAGLPCRPPKWQYGPTLLAEDVAYSACQRLREAGVLVNVGAEPPTPEHLDSSREPLGSRRPRGHCNDAVIDSLVRCCRRDLTEVSGVSDAELRELVRKLLGPGKASTSTKADNEWTWGIDLDGEIAEIERLCIAEVREALAARS